MKPIAIFYHCYIVNGDPPDVVPSAFQVVAEQMNTLEKSGLVEAASQIMIGLNGGQESAEFEPLLFPKKAKVKLHGLASKAENLTLVEIEKFVPTRPDWYVLYCHSKGCSHDPKSDYGKFAARWRNCMMRNCVENWRQCVTDLDAGYESVGCHFMTGLADGTQNIWAGNFWWARSSFLATLPSIYKRDRIKMSGIAALESRYEAEVWIGNGPRLPKVKDYHPNGLGACP